MSTDYEELVKLYEQYKYSCGCTDLDGFIGYVKMKQEKDKKEIVPLHICGNCQNATLDRKSGICTCTKVKNYHIYSAYHECHIKGGFKEKGSTNKPPLGVKPCYIQSSERIKDLAEAISRYADRGDYQVLRKWAKEILMQCDVAEMEKHNE